MRINFQVPEELCNKTVYHVLKGPMRLSGNLIKQLKYANGILLNGKAARTVDHVKTGDLISVNIEFEEETDITPENRPLSIIYEDDCLLAVDKGPNTPVHPSAGYQTGTLAQAVLWHFHEQGLRIKVRPVNRLDRDTSGIILFAKNAFIQEQLVRQMKEKRIYKSYLGIVHGAFEPASGTIRLPIARKEGSVLERVIDESGDDSITHYETVACYSNLSLVRFVLETGRTHQIRVHAKAMGHPIVGDWLYSDIPTNLIDRQALHSHQFFFDHPITGKRIELTSPLPDDMKNILVSMQIQEPIGLESRSNSGNQS